MVVNASPRPSTQNQLVWEPSGGGVVAFPDSDLRRATVDVGHSMVGLESSRRYQWWNCTFELVEHSGYHSLGVLADLGLLCNYLNVQECTKRNLEVGEEQ